MCETHLDKRKMTLAALGLVAVALAALPACDIAYDPSKAPPRTPPAEAPDSGSTTATPAPATQSTTEAEVIEDAWYRVLIDGKHAGHSHHRTVLHAPRQYVTTVEMEQRVLRDETEIAMGSALEIRETGDGVIERFRMEQRLSAVKTIMEGRVEGDRLHVATTGSGAARHQDYPYEPSARGPNFILRRVRNFLKEPGGELQLVTLSPQKLQCGKVTIRSRERETVEIDGVERELMPLDIELSVLPGVIEHQWIDREGVVWKTSFDGLGMTMEEVRSTPEAARLRSGPPPEILARTSVKPDKPLRDPLGARSVTYRFTLRQGNFAAADLESAFSGAGQTRVAQPTPSSRIVRIEAVRPLAKVERPVPVQGAIAVNLKPNVFIQSDDEAIIAQSKEVVGDETDAWEAAKKLERWVHDAITEKTFGTAFASAKETLETREGDCTEHGVLLAALCRAAGIPARVVTGFVYYKDEFYGHMWTEVYIDRWVPLDATRGRGEVGPDHIAVASSTLASATASTVFFDLIRILGNLDIAVVEEK